MQNTLTHHQWTQEVQLIARESRRKPQSDNLIIRPIVILSSQPQPENGCHLFLVKKENQPCCCDNANIVGCPLSVWFEHLIISWVFIISGLRICCFWHCMRPRITPLFCFSQTSSIVFHQSYLHHQTRMLDREIFTFEFKRKHCLRPHPRRNPLWWFLGFSRIGQKVGFGDFRHFLGFFSDRPLAGHCLPARGWTPSPQSWFGIKQRSAKPHICDHHFHHHYHQYTLQKNLWDDQIIKIRSHWFFRRWPGLKNH